ncbi:hypothetical protein Bca4012_095573 [Brassica carinata]
MDSVYHFCSGSILSLRRVWLGPEFDSGCILVSYMESDFFGNIALLCKFPWRYETLISCEQSNQ